ncbi:MAG: hypothetical protein WKF59_20040 [Chitinophagaceae bacterium]
MADNTEDEPLENKPIAELKIFQMKSFLLLTRTSLPQIKKQKIWKYIIMHSTKEKKTWKSYFWEFLMLFLAVFCGFLAEYQLEHKIEKDRNTVCKINDYRFTG